MHRNAIRKRSRQEWINYHRITETLISMPEMIVGKRKMRSAWKMPDDIGKCKRRKRKSEKVTAKKRNMNESGKKGNKNRMRKPCHHDGKICAIMPEISAVLLPSLPQVLPCFYRCHYCRKFPYAHAYICPKKSEKGSAYAQESKPELVTANYR